MQDWIKKLALGAIAGTAIIFVWDASNGKIGDLINSPVGNGYMEDVVTGCLVGGGSALAIMYLIK